ncbi:hypothetical protein N0V90_003902 [Kalmusia sp. IMI 367209]|nr:hypothetical protein N0V90_003902 [Kalmusia sp. IMI 367209]
MITTHTATHSAPRNIKLLPLPKKDQWDLLESELDTTSSSVPLYAAPRWLDVIETPVLLTFLAKLRSEAQFHRSEAERPALLRQKSSGIKFPDYDAGTCGSTCTPPTQTYPSPMPAPVPTPASRPLYRRARYSDEGIGIALERLNTSGLYSGEEKPRRFSLPEKLSPLSPTFGPRKGLVPAGTIQRRRSVPFKTVNTEGNNLVKPAASDTPSYSTGTSDFKWATPVVQRKPGRPEKKILWQAVWAEIERNLDIYTKNFEPNQHEGVPPKEEIWIDLIIMLREINTLKDCHDSTK